MHLTSTRKYYTRVGIQGKIQLLWLALSVFWFWQVYKLMLFLLDRCYEQFVLIQCCMIVRVLFLLICDTRHSDLAHQGMIFPPEAHLLHFFYPQLIYLHPDHSFSLRIMALFLMWLDRVRLLWDDLSIKGQDKVQTINFFFLLFFFLLPCGCFLKNVFDPCEHLPYPFTSVTPLQINSLNCVLFGSSFLSSFHLVFCFFPPRVWFPFFQRRFQFCFLQQVPLFFFFSLSVFFLSLSHMLSHTYTHTQSDFVDYDCIEWSSLRRGDIFWFFRWADEAVDRRIGNSSQGGIPFPCSIVILK